MGAETVLLCGEARTLRLPSLSQGVIQAAPTQEQGLSFQRPTDISWAAI